MASGVVGTSTIVFSDVVGSTALRSRLGETSADQLRRRHDDAIADVVAKRRGTVVKTIGDGVMAAFESASDAIDAAIGMHRAIADLSRVLSLDLMIRVGLSAGDVAWDDGDCFGLPVVEAARLEHEASPGQILCSDIVRVLARGRTQASFERVGELSLKGLDEPLTAYAIKWDLVDDGAAMSPFAGRVDALTALATCFVEAQKGTGATVLVAGEPGAGKTRLVAEALARDGEVTAVWGHSYAAESLALGPVVEVLDDLARLDASRLRRCAAHHDRVIAQLSQAAAAAWTDVGMPDLLALHEQRQRVHGAVADTLAEWAAESPLVAVFDDLHWADEMSVSVFRALARRTRSSGLVVLGTYRQTDLDRAHSWGAALPLVVREVEPLQLGLTGLSRDEVGDLIAGLAGATVDAALISEIATNTAGNPLFVGEIARHLAESGAFNRDDQGVWTRVASVPADVPRGVRQVIGARVSRLGTSAQEFLAVASVFEGPFPLSVTATVAGLTDSEALDCIDAAQLAGLVVPGGEFDVYDFSHAVVRQTLYDEATLSRRVRLHRRVANALEATATGEPTGPIATLIARHYAYSAMMPGAETGVRWAHVAALDAHAKAAFADAVRQVEVAGELAGPTARMPDELLIVHAEALAALGRPAAATVACARAALQLDDEEAAASLYARCARLLEAGNAPITAVWDLADIGLARCGDRRDAAWLVLRDYQLTGSEVRDPNYIGIPLDSAEKQELAEVSARLASPLLLRYPPRHKAQILAHPNPHPIFLVQYTGHLREAIAGGWDLVNHARRNGLGGDELYARAMLARALFALGRIDEWREVIDQGADLYRRSPKTNSAIQFGVTVMFPGMAFTGLARDEPVPMIGTPGLTFGAIIDKDYAILSRGRDPSRLYVSATGQLLIASWLAAWGERERPREVLERCAPLLVRAPAGNINQPVHPGFLVDTMLALNDFRYADHVRAIANAVIAADFIGPEHCPRHALARLEARSGNADAARHWFDQSRGLRGVQGATPHLALLDLHQAEAELHLGSPPGVIRALLDRARPELERLSATARLADCDRIESALR